MFTSGTFIIKLVYKFKGPKIEMSIAKNYKEGEIIQPCIKTHFKVTTVKTTGIVQVREIEQRPRVRSKHEICDTGRTTEHPGDDHGLLINDVRTKYCSLIHTSQH